MQVENTITVTVLPGAKGAKLLRDIAKVIESAGISSAKADDEEAPAPKKRGPKPKAKEEPEADDTDETEVEEAEDENDAEEPDLEDDGDEAEEDEAEEDEPEEKPAKKAAAAKGISDEDLGRAFAKLAKERGRPKALKVLEKFKVKNCTAIPQDKRALALKVIKAATA